MKHYTTYTDGELVRMLRQGDRAAFTEVYNRYWEKLFYLAGKKLEDTGEAENIIQDLFVDLWERRETLDIQNSVAGYLIVAVKYRILNLLARQERARKIEQSIRQNTPAADMGTLELLKFEDLKDWLETLVNKLPEKCQMVYRLREQGLSQREIAETLQISEKTVETHVTRALKTIRGGLKDFTAIFLSILP